MSYIEYLGRIDYVSLKIIRKLARLTGSLLTIFFGFFALLALLSTALFITREISSPTKLNLLVFLVILALSITCVATLSIYAYLADTLLSKSAIKINKSNNAVEAGNSLKNIGNGSWVALLVVVIVAALYSTRLPHHELQNNHEAIIFWFVLALYAIFHFYFFATTKRIANKLLSGKHTA